MKKFGVGRNSPCPCGSGKKYKKCCLEKSNGLSENVINHFIPNDIKIEYGKPLLNESFYKLKTIGEFTAQRLLYSNLLIPEVENIVNQAILKKINRSKEEAELIEKAKYSEELINLMNQNLDTINHVLFMEKSLKYKGTFIPILFDELKKPKDDAFIELAIRIIHRTRIDYSNEIINLIKTNLNQAYQISQFCILLGFYPNAESEQILWNYFNYFRENLPNQPYQDGPLLGLIEIKEQKKERFLKRLQAKT